MLAPVDEASHAEALRFASSCAVDEGAVVLKRTSPLFCVGQLMGARTKLYAVVFSMSHALGDLAIFRVIYDMVFSSEKVWTVDPTKCNFKSIGVIQGRDIRQTQFRCPSCGDHVPPTIGEERGVLYDYGQTADNCPELSVCLEMPMRPQRSTPDFRVWRCGRLHDATWAKETTYEERAEGIYFLSQ